MYKIVRHAGVLAFAACFWVKGSVVPIWNNLFLGPETVAWLAGGYCGRPRNLFSIDFLGRPSIDGYQHWTLVVLLCFFVALAVFGLGFVGASSVTFPHCSVWVRFVLRRGRRGRALCLILSGPSRQ